MVLPCRSKAYALKRANNHILQEIANRADFYVHKVIACLNYSCSFTSTNLYVAYKAFYYIIYWFRTDINAHINISQAHTNPSTLTQHKYQLYIWICWYILEKLDIICVCSYHYNDWHLSMVVIFCLPSCLITTHLLWSLPGNLKVRLLVERCY